jgi:hypothetical protein
VNQSSWVSSAAVATAVAVILAAATFWWVNLRRGRLKSFSVRSFAAAANGQQNLLCLPLVIYNTGALPIVVQDLRLRLVGPDVVFWWGNLRDRLPPGDDDKLKKLPAVFAINGRTFEQLYAEFHNRQFDLRPNLEDQLVIVEALTPHHKEWRQLVQFKLHLSAVKTTGSYLAWSNDPDFDQYLDPDSV